MKLLLFDLDGTLVTTGGAGLRALDRAFETLLSLPKAMEGISPAGKTDPCIVREVFRKKLNREPGPASIQQICDCYLRFLEEEMQVRNGYRVMEGVVDLVAGLSVRENVLLALGTGNLEKGARIKLEPSGLNPYFSFGGFGSDAEARPEVLRKAVSRAEERTGQKIPAKDVFVIGDTILDVRAGKAIGAVTVAVVCGHGNSAELQASGPDLLLEDFRKPDRLLGKFH
ncbi:MAG: HAD hydrolase-like protein [Elusimicrobia bacterium]|nr:HAD hydrolase-like protein [Elusimicrobiota bacterium]